MISWKIAVKQAIVLLRTCSFHNALLKNTMEHDLKQSTWLARWVILCWWFHWSGCWKKHCWVLIVSWIGDSGCGILCWLRLIKWLCSLICLLPPESLLVSGLWLRSCCYKTSYYNVAVVCMHTCTILACRWLRFDQCLLLIGYTIEIPPYSYRLGEGWCQMRTTTCADSAHCYECRHRACVCPFVSSFLLVNWSCRVLCLFWNRSVICAVEHQIFLCFNQLALD